MTPSPLPDFDILFFEFLLNIFLFFTLTVRGWNHQKKKSNKTDLKNSLTTMANKFLILMEKTSKETNLFTFHKSFNGFLDMKNREFIVCTKKKKILNSKLRTFIFINLLDIVFRQISILLEMAIVCGIIWGS